MKQKFNGEQLNITSFFDVFNLTPNTPDSLFQCPLLNEIVIESPSLSDQATLSTEIETESVGVATTTEPETETRVETARNTQTHSTLSMQKCRLATAAKSERMRRYSEAREVSCGAARPLVLATVAFCMILVLLYLLIHYPLTYTINDVSRSSIMSNESTTSDESKQISETKTETSTVTDNGIYKNIDDTSHRRQIPLIHTPFVYQVTLKLFLPWNTNVSYGSDDFAMEGSVRMHFLSGGGSRILLHTDAEQHIGDCVVTDELERPILVKHVGRGHSQVLDLHLSTDMINGMNYTLDVAFRGHISTHKRKGLFAVPFYKNGMKSYVIGTHLQMSEARTVFPCIDVPEVKAHFDVTITHPTGTNAIGNMMENQTIVDGGWTTTNFHRTPPMSTYLFAFSVSDFPYLESFTEKGVRTRVYCDPSKIANCELVLSSVGPLIGFFEEYFGIPYPLDKLDVVILPALEMAAMENWGLITIRQAEGLYYPNRFPVVQKHDVQEVISHEIAHQWFGNLVTMKWWNNLWLNEGFATMIGRRAVDFLENTTFRYQEMTAEFMCYVMREDQKSHSFPVSTNSDEEYEKVLEINPNHKIIVYRKAAIITRMIERLIEEDIFKEGLHRFLNTFIYKNADHQDLFNVLTYVHDTSSGGHLTGQNFSLSDVMDTWLRQPFFPVLHVNRKEGSIVTLRQERYKHSPYIPDSDEFPFIWKIPIFHDDPVSGKHKVFWITDKQPVVFDMAGHLVIDSQQLTYVRIFYDLEMFSDITMQLVKDFTQIPINSRSRLIDDSLAMAESSQISYKIPFNLTMYLPRETSFRPIQTYSAYIDYFLPRMYLHENYSKYREYLLVLFGSQFDRISKKGFDDSRYDSVDEYKLSELVIYRSCLIDYAPCNEMSKKKFQELKKSCPLNDDALLSNTTCNKIPFYMRQYVYGSAIAHGSQEDFDYLFEKWKNENFMIEKARIWHGMCATTKRENSDKMWMTMLRNSARENVRDRAVSCSKYLPSNSFVLNLLMTNSAEIKSLLRKAPSTFKEILILTVRRLRTQEDLMKVGIVLHDYAAYHGFPFELIQHQFFEKENWRENIAPWIIGNASSVIGEMRKLRVPTGRNLNSTILKKS